MSAFLLNYFEEEYQLARMECFHCRAMGDRAGLRRATRAAWQARRNVRMSDPRFVQ